jgi:CheY-like chemotaxis protein
MTAPKTILLVDDDPDIINTFRPLLESKGYRVVIATDGNTALATAESVAPQLVVVDMMMPRKSGLLVLERLKSPPNRDTRVIMITANEGMRHQAYAEHLGVDDYIRKPFPVERLLESIERLCPLAPQEEQSAG